MSGGQLSPFTPFFLKQQQFLFIMGVWYEPSRDGTIEEYIQHCKDERVPKCFKGPEQFQQLVDLGYMTPDITTIRIMYTYSRGDEHYGVNGDFNLEGIVAPQHAGKEGIHNPQELLSGNTPYFEIDNINPNPEPRNP